MMQRQKRMTRTVNGVKILWFDDAGLLHACESAEIHTGIRLVWTLCGKAVPSGYAFAKRRGETEPLTCLICRALDEGDAGRTRPSGLDAASEEVGRQWNGPPKRSLTH